MLYKNKAKPFTIGLFYIINVMNDYSTLDVRAFVSRYAVWIARTKTQVEATEYAEKVLKDNPIILNLVLGDIQKEVDKK